MAHAEGFLKVVNDAKKVVQQCDIRQADEMMQSDPTALLIDVREDDEFRREHVKGAMHLGKGVIERDIEEKIPNHERPLLLYCGGGFRSALAAESLKKMGYTNVWSVDGGYRAYKDADKEMESGMNAA